METLELKTLLEQAGALLEGHFILSSGKHSDRYVQCALLLQHPARAGLIGAAIGALWRGSAAAEGRGAERGADERIDVVLGPALGGVVVAHEVARYLGTRALFAERRDGAMVLRRGFTIEPGERVLLVEDVVTTGGSVVEIAQVVLRAGGEVAGASAIIDRRGQRGAEAMLAIGDELSMELRALLQVEASAWEPASCPLCSDGLPANKPGSREAR